MNPIPTTTPITNITSLTRDEARVLCPRIKEIQAQAKKIGADMKMPVEGIDRWKKT